MQSIIPSIVTRLGESRLVMGLVLVILSHGTATPLAAVERAPLSVRVTGAGTVSPNYNGRQLEIGRRYSLTATPKPGNLFSNWTGAAGQFLGDHPVYSFTMSSNIALTASFVTNHFKSLAGAYQGLFFPMQKVSLAGPGEISPLNSGSFHLQLASNGTFSGSVVLSGISSGFTGKFSVTNEARVAVTRSGGQRLSLELRLDPDGRCRGVVHVAGWESPLESVRLGGEFEVYFNRALGTHTLLVVPQKDSVGGPAGYGALNVRIDRSQAYVTTTTYAAWKDGNTSYYHTETRQTLQPQRLVKVVGTLADASVVTASGGADRAGWWPLYAPLYGGRGMIMGWLNVISNDVAHRCVWLRPTVSGGKLFASGFADSRPGLFSWVAPTPAAEAAVNWTRASLVVGGGNLTTPLTNDVIMTNHQLRVVSGALSNTVIDMERTKGLFSGSFRHPLTRATTPFQGALAPPRSISTTEICFTCYDSDALPESDGWIEDISGFHAAARTWGAGWFLGPSEGGFVRLDPRFTPESLAGWRLTLLNSNAVDARAFLFDGTTFIESGAASGAGTYLFVELSPASSRIEMRWASPPEMSGMTLSLELNHTGPFDGSYNSNGVASATRRFVLDRPDHFAPASLQAMALVLTRSDGSRHTKVFGLDTYSRTGSSRLGYGDGDYTYLRSGPGVARLSLVGSIFGADAFEPGKTANYSQAEETQLNFTSPTSGYFGSMTAQPDKLPSAAVVNGRFLLVSQPEVVPASVAGRNLVLNGTTGVRTEFSLGEDDFSTLGSRDTGTYNFRKQSADGASVSMESTNLYTHVRLKFISPTNGLFGRIHGRPSSWSFAFESGTFLLK